MNWLNNLNCCHLLGIFFIFNFAETALFLGYTFKINKQQIQLELNGQNHQLRIKELEKKNGSELARISELEKKLAELNKK